MFQSCCKTAIVLHSKSGQCNKLTGTHPVYNYSVVMWPDYCCLHSAKESRTSSRLNLELEGYSLCVLNVSIGSQSSVGYTNYSPFCA